MTKLSSTDLKLNGDDEIFAQMMASMSLLSDAQFLLIESSESKDRVVKEIDHAKMHLGEAMKLYHKNQSLPGKFITFGGDEDSHRAEET